MKVYGKEKVLVRGLDGKMCLEEKEVFIRKPVKRLRVKVARTTSVGSILVIFVGLKFIV